MTTFHDYVIEALEAVLDYGLNNEEMPDESFRQAVITQACIMARSYLD